MLDAALTSIFGSAESLVAGVSTVDFLLCCLASIVLGAASFFSRLPSITEANRSPVPG